MTHEVVYKGDIVIFNNKDKVSTSDNRAILENGVPYFVVELGASKGAFYIQVYGKEILLFDTDMKYIEHVQIANRYNFGVNNYVKLLNISRIDNAEKNNFNSSEIYKITKLIMDNGFLITNGESELWIKDNELPYVELIKNNIAIEPNKESAITDIQALIDKALDERDFKMLERLHKNIK
ncbi:hypothetical protein [Lysinibacillus sp. NPDC086135]|uniref:hypothetical protein n=1 Tax=Lysinibacillus sp. NPDC086135 TaxID=3364130 RepID=UPI003829FE64